MGEKALGRIFYVGRREAQGGRFYLIFLSPSLCLTGNLLVFHQIKIALKVKSLPEIAGIGERQRWIYNSTVKITNALLFLLKLQL